MIIGLCGAAGAGKGSVAGFLVSEHGFAEMAFADPLYQMISALTGLTVDELHDRSIKEAEIEWIGRSPRYLLQTLGTEWGRGMVRQDIWIKAAMTRSSGRGRVVIADVRFDNEAEAVRQAGGAVWRVVRGGESCLSGDTAAHSSEAGVASELVDLTIFNNGTLQDLGAAVDTAIRKATRRYNGGIAPCPAS